MLHEVSERTLTKVRPSRVSKLPGPWIGWSGVAGFGVHTFYPSPGLVSAELFWGSPLYHWSRTHYWSASVPHMQGGLWCCRVGRHRTKATGIKEQQVSLQETLGSMEEATPGRVFGVQEQLGAPNSRGMVQIENLGCLSLVGYPFFWVPPNSEGIWSALILGKMGIPTQQCRDHGI